MQREDRTLNPYLDGRREWNERYGSYIKQASNWKIIAILSLIITIIAVGGISYIGSQSKFVPYIVQMDKIGASVAGGIANKATEINENVIKYGLADFVNNFRTVYSDPEIQKNYVFGTYRYLASNFPAYMKVSEYFQNNSPFERSQDEIVGVSINSVLQMSKNSWQVDWTETITNNHGTERAKVKYRGLASIEILSPTAEEEILKNPIGLYIQEFTWSKQLDTESKYTKDNK